MSSPLPAPSPTRRLLLCGGGVAAMALWSAPSRATRGVAAANAPLVVLDPGHGGKDPGAIGVSGTYEKHVAFAAATELRRRLLATGRYRVELTRGTDVFVPLERRVEWAQSRGAALFMSMHADALADPGVRGASVYTLGATASDAQTAALAQRENAADRFGPGSALAVPPDVAKILSGLIRQETRLRSARVARAVVGSLAANVPLLSNPSRHAGFVVLKAADIPSVLVEMGFMSNSSDEAALRQVGHRARVAAALHRAIDGFFETDTAVRLAG